MIIIVVTIIVYIHSLHVIMAQPREFINYFIPLAIIIIIVYYIHNYNGYGDVTSQYMFTCPTTSTVTLVMDCSQSSVSSSEGSCEG